MFLGKGIVKLCSIFTGEHPCRSAIPIKLLCNFIEIALQHGCAPVTLLHIFGTPSANEIVLPDSHTVVTYANDGSAQNGVGNYVVQSFSINGKQRTLPTMNIFTESKTSFTLL